MTDLVVYLNPRAGGGRCRAAFERLAATLAPLRQAPVVEDGDQLAAALAAGTPIRLLVVGGDGTLHWVVNDLVRRALLDRVAVGILPAGTGGDFARALGLPRDLERAAAAVLAAAPRPIDLFELDCAGERHRVVNVASAGISGRVDELVNAEPERGSLTFLKCTLQALLHYAARPCRVELDGARWYEGPAYLFAMANGTSFGKGMKVAPRAVLDDGLADVVLVRDVPRWRIPLRLPRIYLGTHLASRFVAYARAREIAYTPLEPIPPLDLDGETSPSGPLVLRVLPGALRILG